jgi:hypothetical protein
VRGALAHRALADLSTLRKRCDALPHKRFKSAEHIEDELAELVSLACRTLKSTVAALADRQNELQRKLAKARADLRAQGGNLRGMDAFELKAAARMGLVCERQAEEELARRRSELPTLPSVLGPTSGNGAGWLPCASSGARASERQWSNRWSKRGARLPVCAVLQPHRESRVRKRRRRTRAERDYEQQQCPEGASSAGQRSQRVVRDG